MADAFEDRVEEYRRAATTASFGRIPILPMDEPLVLIPITRSFDEQVSRLVFLSSRRRRRRRYAKRYVRQMRGQR